MTLFNSFLISVSTLGMNSFCIILHFGIELYLGMNPGITCFEDENPGKDAEYELGEVYGDLQLDGHKGGPN